MFDLTTDQANAILSAIAIGMAAGVRLWWMGSARRAEYSKLEAANVARARAKRIQSDIRARVMGTL